MPNNSANNNESTFDFNNQNNALISSIWRLLVPVARLCLAKGITFAVVEDVLKRAFIQEANALQPDAPEHGMVSRVSTATGINRREVTRLVKLKAPNRPKKPPLASEVFARWTTDTALQNHDGLPRAIKRQGPAPSFEALAQEVTRDVHPRSLLDELFRLGLVSYNEELDSVSLTRNDFVPKSDALQMFDFLGHNVGDHLDAAVENILHDGCRHQEQAIFADELSAESIESLRPLISGHWNSLRDAMVPKLGELIESDRLANREQNHRVRIGFYTYTEATLDAENIANAPTTRQYFKSSPKGVCR